MIQKEALRRGVSFAPHVFISDFERSWINATRKTVNYSLFLILLQSNTFVSVLKIFSY